MSIFGIGIDILNINRIKSMDRKKQKKLANKILHPKEINNFKNCINIYNFLSHKFNIKEATVKALGIGIRNKLSLNQIEIIYDKYGKPSLKFYKYAFYLIKYFSISKIHVSLSHEKFFSCAIVILESN